MIEQQGLVRKIVGGVATVELQPTSGCGSCSAGVGCGGGLFSRFFGQRSSLVELTDPIGVKPGDEVVVGVAENTLLAGAFSLYAMPLFGMIAAAIAGSWLAGVLTLPFADLIATAAGFGGLTLVLGWNRSRSSNPAAGMIKLLRISHSNRAAIAD